MKTFEKAGASAKAMDDAIEESKRVHLKQNGDSFLLIDCMHLLSLKSGTVSICSAVCYAAFSEQISFPIALILLFFSLNIFASPEPLSDSAHVLSVIDVAMNQLDRLKEKHYINENTFEYQQICFDHVSFDYDERKILKDFCFNIPEKT